jgi:diguanylate cyclase (GGDEF)-like protein
VALWFNRGRASVFAVSLLLAWGACEYARELGGFSLQAVYTALVVLVPVNLLASFVAAERGVLFHHNYRWGLLLGSELLVVGWIASAGRSAASGTAWYRLLDHWALRSPPTPLAGRILFAAAFVAAVWRAWPRGARTHVRPLDAGLACATAGLFLACEWQRLPGVFALFMSATGLVLLVAVMQESHRLAFRDELTGLPSRRALEERLHALGPEYAVAMVDVDHFKKFNDTHGHDIGDQVLRLVAARLAQVGGGGRAFRYGGEEFCVLFNGLAPGDALAHIEATRASVQAYRMAVRSEARPADRARGESLRAPLDAPSQPHVLLSVTVSAGVAGKRADEAYRTPYEVIKSADEALYRAKGAGRNRVSD